MEGESQHHLAKCRGAGSEPKALVTKMFAGVMAHQQGGTTNDRDPPLPASNQTYTS